MKITLLVIGKTDARYLAEAVDEYKSRLAHYLPFELAVIPDVKNVRNLSEMQQKEREGELILKALQAGDYLVLLDEGGRGALAGLELARSLGGAVPREDACEQVAELAAHGDLLNGRLPAAAGRGSCAVRL